jgi:3-dehydroquinate dehydratase-1
MSSGCCRERSCRNSTAILRLIRKARPESSASKSPGKLVGVIATSAALTSALRLRIPPDLFELRLDALHSCLDEIERAIPELRAPLIITARHPAEGGVKELNARARRNLLLRFLQRASFLDLELRSIRELKSVIGRARAHHLGLILSCHDFQDTPPLNELHRLTKTAATLGADICKIATRTDTRLQLDRLISFFEGRPRSIPVAAMGLGKLGAESRRRLALLGSALNYASVGATNAEGQLSLSRLRRARRAYTI